MNMKKNGSISWWITGIILTIGVFVGGSPVFPLNELPQQFTITVSETEVRPGQEVLVSYTASSDWNANAWVGLIPANIPLGDQKIADENDLDYRHLKNTRQGKLSFIIPDVEGIFNFRLYPSDDDSYSEVAVSESIKVVREPIIPLDANQNGLKTENENLKTYLFATEPIGKIETSEKSAEPEIKGDLGIGNLK
jgi:hypothetical protein